MINMDLNMEEIMAHHTIIMVHVVQLDVAVSVCKYFFPMKCFHFWAELWLKGNLFLRNAFNDLIIVDVEFIHYRVVLSMFEGVRDSVESFNHSLSKKFDEFSFVYSL